MESLAKRDVLVYSCGSLFTSIVPCLTLRGLATAISTSPTLKAKVLLRRSIDWSFEELSDADGSEL